MFASPCVTAEISPTEATDDDSNTKIVHCIHLGQELGSPTVVFVGQTMVLDMPYLLVTCMSTGSTWSEMVEDFLFCLTRPAESHARKQQPAASSQQPGASSLYACMVMHLCKM